MTEFALVLPVLIVILFGILDFGRAIYAYNTIGNAARDGARVAAVDQIATSPDCVANKPVEDPVNPHWSIKQCAISAAIALGVQASDVAIAYAPPPTTSLTCGSPLHVGCIASVTVTYQFTPITPVISTIVGPITLSSTSKIPIERVFP